MEFKQWFFESQARAVKDKLDCLIKGISDYWPIFIQLEGVKTIEGYLLSRKVMKKSFNQHVKDFRDLENYLHDLSNDFHQYLNYGHGDVNNHKNEEWFKNIYDSVISLSEAITAIYFVWLKSKSNKIDEVQPDMDLVANHLLTLDNNTGSKFSQILIDCFPQDNGVDWRPNETTPEDYYAL